VRHGPRQVRKIFENDRDDFSNSKKIHSWENEREDGTSALRRKRTCYHRRNGAGSFAMFAAIRRASRRRDGICGDVIQSSARGWGVL
jgi:hypothetical protein